MKNIVAVLFLSLFTFGCATTYTPISKLDSVGDATAKNEDFEISVGIQQMGDNSRFTDNLQEEKISLLKLSIKNISAQPITIKNENIYLRTIPDNAPVSQLMPEDVSARMKLGELGYWLWGLLWFGTTESVDGQVTSHWYPVGLVIGGINYFMAKSTNGNFEKDITSNSFHSGEIKAGEIKQGMIYFNRRGGQRYNFIVSYADSLGKSKELSVAYKL